MNNGGGPACLRLRVVLDDAELKGVHGGVVFTDAMHAELVECINRKYREDLHPDDLADPSLIRESDEAVDEILSVLRLDGVI
jgi:succinylarginine dihydrolase